MTWAIYRRLRAGLVAAAYITLAGTAAMFGAASFTAEQPQKDESWVRYALPGTRNELTARWTLVRTEGDQLVLQVDTYLNGELRVSREIKRAPLWIPEQYRRETIVAGGKKYQCKVFQSGTTTYWYSERVPLLGIVRSQNGDHDIMELLDFSIGRQR